MTHKARVIYYGAGFHLLDCVLELLSKFLFLNSLENINDQIVKELAIMPNRYHINFKTGEINICKADENNPQSNGCIFSKNGAPPKHFDSREEAAGVYEAKMKVFAIPQPLKLEEKPPTMAALRKEQNEWFEKLTKDEESALGLYSKPHFHTGFNERLRQNVLNDRDKEIMQHLDRALSKSNKGSVLNVHRGLTMTKSELSNILATGRIENAGYSSTSFNLRMAQLFASNNDFTSSKSSSLQKESAIITFKTNEKSVLDLGEHEILLKRGLKLKVLSHELDKNSVNLFYCEVQ